MNLTIRKAEVSDIKIICSLGITTFYEAYFASDDSKDLADYVLENFSFGQIEKELKDKNSTFFLAEIERSAVGYAKLRENSPAECLEGENTIEIHRVYILEKMKGKRVGDALMKKCFEEAKKKHYESVWLGVWEENLLARKFYQKYGFEKVGELQFPYGDVIGTNHVLKLDLNRYSEQ